MIQELSAAALPEQVIFLKRKLATKALRPEVRAEIIS